MGAPRQDDNWLIDQVIQGDEDAFRILYRRHTPRLYGVTLRLAGGRHHDADDATQEAWVRAIAGLGSFRRQSAFGTWLIGIGLRCTLEILRRRGPLLPEPGLETAGRSDDPAHGLDLERALAQLAPGYRAVVLMHDVEGYTHAEIAALLDIDEGTSKSQLSRARRHLRAAIDPHRHGVLL